MAITSSKNPLLQEIRRAAHAGRPIENGCVVLEGPILLEEARRSGWPVEQVFVTADARRRWAHLLDGNGRETEVGEKALQAIASTETAQGLLALVRPRAWQISDLAGAIPLIMVLDGIQDPGNAGTLLRSAEAFGASGVIACAGSVRLANGKFLRATAGSVFRMPFLENLSTGEAVKLLDRLGAVVYALDAHAQLRIDDADLTLPCALAVGNEAHGISEALRTKAIRVSIPMAKVESLNAGVAGSIALFAAARQRESR